MTPQFGMYLTIVIYKHKFFIAQATGVEHFTHNPMIKGSNPIIGTGREKVSNNVHPMIVIANGYLSSNNLS